MSKRINYYSKRLAKADKEPKDCTDKQLQKICSTYTDYLDALCTEDGYVNLYDRTSNRISPYFEELEKRGLK